MNFKFQLYIILFLLSLTITQTFAQKTISGRITDLQTNEPLVGVNIVIQGTQQGTNTDAQGSFSLSADNIQNLEISYIGYISQVVSIKENINLNIQLKADNINLNEIQVVGFDNTKKLQETPAAVGVLTSKDLERGNTYNLQPVLQTIAGVRMDQTNLANSRISIRGGGIRAPFGIRNIKIYLNEIPITEADGFTRIEAVDVATIGRVEVVKGPASSIYGAGTGGVINFYTQKSKYGENSLEASSLLGSYGLWRLSSTYRYGDDKFNANITYGRQNYDGYREHGADFRNFFTGTLQFYPSSKQNISVLISRSTQLSAIPGQLTATQVAENPRQAAVRNQEQNARRDQTWTRLGLSHSYDFTNNFSNVTSIFTSNYELDHPLAFAYLRQSYSSIGGRTRFIYDVEALKTKFIVGGEYVRSFNKTSRYQNLAGQTGNLILDQENTNEQYSIFYQSETKITDKTTLTLGVSLNQVEYKSADFLNNGEVRIKTFDAEITPRIALNHVFSKKIATYGNISFGFAPPSGSEVTDENGLINEDIQAEKAINYEIGAKGSLLQNKLTYEVALFSLQVEDKLIQQSFPGFTSRFNNAGQTSQRGLETAVAYNFIQSKTGFVNLLRAFGNYTFSDFEFRDFKILNSAGEVTANNDGNDLTGISPHVFTIGLDLNTRQGLYWYTTYNFTDKAPITDDNSVFNEAYSVLNTKIGFRNKIIKSLEFDVYFGIDNLLNEKYTSQVSLNATSFVPNVPPAYFNPAPEISYYGGFSLKYLFNQ